MMLWNVLLSPISIVFLVFIVGYYLGKIKVFGISFDLAGVLIVAVGVGWVLTVIGPIKDMLSLSDLQTDMKLFSSFGTALFVSSMGITAGCTINSNGGKGLKAALIGSLMMVSAFILMKFIFSLDANISFSKLLGAWCGALTTTPGLSAVSELQILVEQETILGYSATYLFGVVFTVLFAQIVTRENKDMITNESTLEKTVSFKSSLRVLMLISFTVLFGRVIGVIEILNFSLGDSGGMLFAGISFGLIVRKFDSWTTIDKKLLDLFRNFGLVLFFAGKGIPAGVQLAFGFELKIVLYGALMTITPIFIGWFLCKLMFKDESAVTTVVGGMTSTPAMGVVIQKNPNIQMNRYSSAYIGALITIIFLVRINLG